MTPQWDREVRSSAHLDSVDLIYFGYYALDQSLKIGYPFFMLDLGSLSDNSETLESIAFMVRFPNTSSMSSCPVLSEMFLGNFFFLGD